MKHYLACYAYRSTITKMVETTGIIFTAPSMAAAKRQSKSWANEFDFGLRSVDPVPSDEVQEYIDNHTPTSPDEFYSIRR